MSPNSSDSCLSDPNQLRACCCRPLPGTMTTLDDKLLGEKLQYYYSSSEEEDSDHEDKDRGRGALAGGSTPADADLVGEGISVNTGTGDPGLWE